MNILQLTKSLHKGGVESHILDLSEHLIKRGNSVIVASDNLAEEGEFKKKKIEVNSIRFMSKSPKAVWGCIQKIHGLIKENDIDLVHCHWRICCLYMKLHNWIYHENVPYIWTCHLAGMKNSFMLRMLTAFDKYIIGVSSDCTQMVMDTFKVSDEYVKTVYNGIHILENVEELKISDESTFRLTILSRLNPIKNHACMLRALKRLIYDFNLKNIKLTITGDGNDAYKSELQ